MDQNGPGEPRQVIVTVRLSNGEARSHQFDKATVHVKGPFVLVHHQKGEFEREDWFGVGTVVRVEILLDRAEGRRSGTGGICRDAPSPRLSPRTDCSARDKIKEVHVSPYFCAPRDKKRIARINKALAPVTDWPEW